MNKKNWVFGVVFVMMMVLGLVTMVGCQSETPESGKVVEAKYRGTWVDKTDSRRYFILTENTYTFYGSGSSSPSPAYTTGKDLYVDDVLWGTFDDDGINFSKSNMTFTKQQP